MIIAVAGLAAAAVITRRVELRRLHEIAVADSPAARATQRTADAARYDRLIAPDWQLLDRAARQLPAENGAAAAQAPPQPDEAAAPGLAEPDRVR